MVGAIPCDTLAKLLKLTPRRVRQLARRGIIPPPQARGRYDLVASIHGYIDYLVSRQIAGHVGGGGDPDDRARLVKAKADLAEMHAARLRGDLHPADEVWEAWEPVAIAARQRLLALPTKAAPRVAAEASTPRCEAILREMIEEALAEFGSLDHAPLLHVSGAATDHRANRSRAIN